LEIAFGVGRSLYCALEQNFRQRGDTGYNILSLPRKISPIHVAVFPLVNKDGLEDIAYALNGKLSDQGFISVFDKKGSIGKRYARMDEIGTPFCITIDYQTKEDDSVTIRERDTKSQTRIKIADLTASLYAGLNDTQ
jgi:glycyl-tRNA synthetase